MKTTHVVERNEVPTPSSSLECEACYRYTKTAYNLERFCRVALSSGTSYIPFLPFNHYSYRLKLF